MEKMISLGFSCQSKFTSNLVSCDFRSLPFDFNITTKEFVLSALEAADGNIFKKDLKDLEIYQMPIEKTKGLHKDGIWFWHDFPRDGKDLSKTNLSSINLADKYDHLWKRFISKLNDGSKKRFIVSNTQKNLVEFSTSPEDFKEKFSLDYDFFKRLCCVLDKLSIKDYRITFLVRTMEEYLELCDQPKSELLDVRYAGTLNLNYNSLISSSLVSPEHSDDEISRLCGNYEKGYTVKQSNYGSIIISDQKNLPVAVGRSFYDGFVLCLVGLTDGVVQAIFENNSIIINDKNRTTLKKC